MKYFWKIGASEFDKIELIIVDIYKISCNTIFL